MRYIWSICIYDTEDHYRNQANISTLQSNWPWLFGIKNFRYIAKPPNRAQSSPNIVNKFLLGIPNIIIESP